MVVARRLERAGDRPAEVEQQCHEPVVLLARVQDRHSTPTLRARHLDQHFVASLGDVDRHQNDAIGHSMQGGPGRLSPEWGLEHRHSRDLPTLAASGGALRSARAPRIARGSPLPNVLRAGIHCQSGSGLDRRGRRPHHLHRAGQPLGERLLRELQRQAPRLNSSTGRSSTASARPGWSSRAGGGTTTPFVHTPRLATGRLHPRSSCRARARLRNPGQLQRARSPWKLGHP